MEHEWNVHLEIFSRPQAKEKKNPMQYLLNSPNTYITENSRWVPMINKRMLALEKKKKKQCYEGKLRID